ncbi:hypothetical protein FA95DRAFT_1577466, partial [Auriscalpium vulgare]
RDHLSTRASTLHKALQSTRPRTKPMVRFYDIKKKIFPNSDAADPAMPDEEGDTWLDEPPSADLGRERVVITDTFVNLRSEILQDFLADAPAKTKKPRLADCADKHAHPRLPSVGDGLDNNYKLVF